MIEYALVCEHGHRFDVWFGNARAYDEQRLRGVVVCPECGSTEIDKAAMAPAVARSRADRAEKVSLAAGYPEQERLRAAVKALRDKVIGEADYVGDRFAEEARKIHYEEAEKRGIYGEATRDEVTSLAEEGIECLPLPRIPEDAN